MIFVTSGAVPGLPTRSGRARANGPDLPDGVEAVFVPADPPRHSQLGFWTPDGPPPSGADHELELLVPEGDTVQRRRVAVDLVPLRRLLDPLLALSPDAPAAPSVAAWAAAAKIAVELVARGRLTPGITEAGFDTWRLAPLDPDDVRRQVELAAALPPEAHCRPLDDAGTRLAGPRATVAAFADAVADLVPRTAAAARFAGHRPFAVDEAQPVAHAADWFATITAGGARTTVTLRLVLPTVATPDDADGPDPFRAELVLQSPDDPSLLVPVTDLWEAPESVMARFDDVEDTLFLTLRRAARIWPPLQRLLQETRPTHLVLSDDEADELLGPLVEELATAGLFVHWPATLLHAVETRPTISTPQVEKIAGVGLGLDAVLGWQASLDGIDLTEGELEQLATAKRGVVQLRDRWVRADPTSLRRLSESRPLSAGEAVGAALGGSLLVDGAPTDAEVVGPLAALGARLRRVDFQRDQPEPPGLDAELRPYQRRGLAWMIEMADLGLGGVLADDMGLGKTIQLLALHLHRIDTGATRQGAADQGLAAHRSKPTLVVCPATLVANWERETGRFAPSVPVRRYHGPDRTLDDLDPRELVVTTYGVVRRDRDALAAVDWGLVAADEAQAIKNPLSRSASASRSRRTTP
ncbi:MAG: SNF2-related protein [Actinomycetota bacterium]